MKAKWYVLPKKSGKHWDIFLQCFKYGNTARFNDEWLEKRYNSKNEEWCGEHKYFKIYDKLVSWGEKNVE